MPSRTVRRLAWTVLGLSLLAAGCSSIDVWPFGNGEARERSLTPANATEYRCQGGKRFYVRELEQGQSVWVILPEREFRLDKAAATAGRRYANGSVTLDLDAGGATLTEGGSVLYGACKSGAPAGGAKAG
jgi:membrane-bound inhibitor of C-type lysozyme